MSDEIQGEGQVDHNDAPEVNEVEVKAREQGWVPKEEWTGEGKWRDAETFLDRGELFQKINSQHRKLRDLEETQRAFASHLETVKKASYNEALAKLRAEKRDALVEGDPDAVIEADEKIAQLRDEQRQAVAAVAQSGPHPDFVEWQDKNTWYSDSNRAMKAFADVEGIKLAKANPNWTPREVLKEIEAQVRKEFPEKFTNPNRARASAVEGGAKAPQGRETYQLTEDETKIMNRLVKSGTLTKEKYIADIKAAKGIK